MCFIERTFVFLGVLWPGERVNFTFLKTNTQDNTRKDRVLKRLRLLKGLLSAVGVSQLGLFGSTVRGENHVAVI